MATDIEKIEQQRAKLQQKYKGEAKKNQNLLKMNSNLMKQNQTYLECFTTLKKWSLSAFQSNHQMNQSIDVQEAEQFVNNLIQQFTKAIQQKSHLKLDTQINEIQCKDQIYINCQKCQRWKGLYLKQIQQNNRLNTYVSSLQKVNEIKKVNFQKLTLDIENLLNDYLFLFKKKWNQVSSRSNVQQITQKKQKQRKSDKSKQKVSNTKQKSFSKEARDKSRQKYDDLQHVKQIEFIKSYKVIAEDLRQSYKCWQKQINTLREQINQLQEILQNYRQRERNRILYGQD